MPTKNQKIVSYLEEIGSYDSTTTKPDPKGAAQLRKQAKQAATLVEEARLLTEAEELESGVEQDAGPHPDEATFIAEGKAWALRNGISPTVLRDRYGVPAAVLRKAGYRLSGDSTKAKPRGARTRKPWAEGELEQAVKSMRGNFTRHDVAKVAKREVPGTKLEASGLVKIVKKGGKGQGNATIYAKV